MLERERERSAHLSCVRYLYVLVYFESCIAVSVVSKHDYRGTTRAPRVAEFAAPSAKLETPRASPSVRPSRTNTLLSASF